MLKVSTSIKLGPLITRDSAASPECSTESVPPVTRKLPQRQLPRSCTIRYNYPPNFTRRSAFLLLHVPTYFAITRSIFNLPITETNGAFIPLCIYPRAPSCIECAVYNNEARFFLLFPEGATVQVLHSSRCAFIDAATRRARQPLEHVSSPALGFLSAASAW